MKKNNLHLKNLTLYSAIVFFALFITNISVFSMEEEPVQVSEGLTISTFYPDFNGKSREGVKNGICVTFGENIHIARFDSKGDEGDEDNEYQGRNVGVAKGDHLGFTVSTVTESGQKSSRKVTGISKCYNYNSDGDVTTTKVNAFFINLKNEIESDTASIELSYERLPESFPFIDFRNSNKILEDFSRRTIPVNNSDPDTPTNPDTPDSNTPDPNTDNPETNNPDNSDESALTILSVSVDTANGNPNGPKDGLCIEFKENIIGLKDNVGHILPSNEDGTIPSSYIGHISPSYIGTGGFAVSITKSGVTSSGTLTRVSGCSTYRLDPPSVFITPRLNTLFLELSKPIDETTTSITLSYTKSLASGSFVERTNNNRVLKDFSRPVTFDVEVTNSNPETPDSNTPDPDTDTPETPDSNTPDPNTPDPDTDNPETPAQDNSDKLPLTILSVSVDTADGNPNGPKDGLCIEFKENIIGLKDNLRVSRSNVGTRDFSVSITKSGATSSGTPRRVSGCYRFTVNPKGVSLTPRLNTLFLELSEPIDETTTSIALSYKKLSDSGSFVERTNNNRVLKDFSDFNTISVHAESSPSGASNSGPSGSSGSLSVEGAYNGDDEDVNILQQPKSKRSSYGGRSFNRRSLSLPTISEESCSDITVDKGMNIHFVDVDKIIPIAAPIITTSSEETTNSETNSKEYVYVRKENHVHPSCVKPTKKIFGQLEESILKEV